MIVDKHELSIIEKNLKQSKFSLGLEYHPFCVGWYNDCVNEKFVLPYKFETLAFSIISNPHFFDKQFLPFIKNIDIYLKKDPLDQCLSFLLNQIKDDLKYNVKIIHDFETHPNRRPKVLVQTAGHVSGAAYYYQMKDIEHLKNIQKKMYGVSCHPKYGGWFSFRGVLLFEDVEVPSLQKCIPEKSLNDIEILDLLEKFNYHWKDWSYRNVGNPLIEYSDKQKEYFLTNPAERFSLIKQYDS